MTAGDFKQSANLVGKILASGQVSAASTDTTIHTVATNTTERLSTMSVFNSDPANAITVKIGIIPNGGVVDGTHVVANFTLNALDSTVITEVSNAYLEAGAFISLNVSSAAKINYLVTGVVSS